jgi:flagellar L-ring protein precursor FlgH
MKESGVSPERTQTTRSQKSEWERIARAWCLGAALAGFGAPAAWAQLGGSPGSLFTPSGRLADPTRDVRAGEIGDIVTIIVSDTASAVVNGVTNSSRKSSASGSITGLAGFTNSTGRLSNLAGASGNQQLQGQGQTSRTTTISTTVSAKVVDVTANGSLVIEGVKNIGINSEKQTITLRGMVRPADLTPLNTVASNQVADLSIQINGKGVIGDAIKRPFILYRILLGLLPF